MKLNTARSAFLVSLLGRSHLPLKGFTLIELMVVIAVIAILATIALFGLGAARGSARNTQRQQVMNSLRGALERYYGDNSQYITGTDFSAMFTTLSGKGYMSAATDPACGGTPVAMPGTAATFSPCTGVSYAYNGAAAGYTLTLVKEGGGSSLFVSPQ